MIKTKHRIQWLDFAKGLIILFVVLSHSLLSSGHLNVGLKLVEYVILIFAMPLFFAISGYLYKSSNNVHKYKILLYKKITSFIPTYFIFTFIAICLHMTNNHNLLSNGYRFYLIPVSYLWFLYSLFFIFVLVGLMDLLHINLYIQLCISLLFMIIQIYLPCHQNLDNPLTGIGGYMICFYIGYLMKRFNISNMFKKYKSISIYLGITWVALIIIEIYFTGKDNVIGYNNTSLVSYNDILTKLLSIPLFFSLFVNVKHNRFFKYFDKYGKCTFIIYLIHLPIITITDKIFIRLSITNPILLLIVFVLIGWYSSLFVYYLSKKFKLIDFIFYPRKYINKWIN